jgi:hypothetical protein
MNDVEYRDGWYDWETDRVFPFRWMSRQARIAVSREALSKNRYLTFVVFSEFADYSQAMTMSLGGRTLAHLPLLYQWSRYSVDLEAGSAEPRTQGPLERLQFLRASPALRAARLPAPEQRQQRLASGRTRALRQGMPETELQTLDNRRSDPQSVSVHA